MRRCVSLRFGSSLLAVFLLGRAGAAQPLRPVADSLTTAPEFAPTRSAMAAAPAARRWAALRPLALPVALGTGAVLMSRRMQLCDCDQETRAELQEMQQQNGFVRTTVDDHLRTVPAFASLGLSALGMRGRHGTLDQAVLFGLTYMLTNEAVSNLKNATRVMRPNGSGYTSFPSQHTSMAFATATLMHREYGGRSVWYSVGGYSVATATGVLRMLKDNHWLSDVVAGAGVGIASTELTYLLYPVLQRGTKRVLRGLGAGRHSSQVPAGQRVTGAVLPYYAGGAVGVAVVLTR